MAINGATGTFTIRSTKRGFDHAVSGQMALQEFLSLPAPRSWQEGFSTTNSLSTSILHDLRNPLTAISGCAEMLHGANLDPGQTRRVITNIQRAAARMQDLLAALTSMTRGDSEVIEVCNLRAIVLAACEAAGLEDRSDIRVSVNVPARLEIALARTRVERVFLNLIVNAMEAMTIRGEIRIDAVDEGDRIRIIVEDTGPGIPAEIRSRLFEPFATAGKERGIGLGLTFCRQTIRDHGGELWLEAARGARFILSLPQRCSSEQQPVALDPVATNMNPRFVASLVNTKGQF